MSDLLALARLSLTAFGTLAGTLTITPHTNHLHVTAEHELQFIFWQARQTFCVIRNIQSSISVFLLETDRLCWRGPNQGTER
jgi:hypothetical protein